MDSRIWVLDAKRVTCTPSLATRNTKLANTPSSRGIPSFAPLNAALSSTNSSELPSFVRSGVYVCVVCMHAVCVSHIAL